MSNVIERLLSKITKVGKCWEFTGAKDSSGYGNITYEGCIIGAHRASYMLFIGDIPEGFSVLHSCDNPPCINPEHLFLGTQDDNIQDMLTKGRRVIPKQKLNMSDTIEIKQLLQNAFYTQSEIAKLYGVSRQTIYAIKIGLIWRADA